ncbi:hypothetical protein HZA98_03865 [Candidatus Woesearchaeota archaeon]|nr:hypothetical protein [Candidatus Woesearchaeota archaeon]
MALLILSNDKDSHVDYVVPEIKRRNLNFRVVYTNDYLNTFALESKINDKETIHKLDSLNIEDITSIWYRRPLLRKYEGDNPLYTAYINDEIEGYTTYFFNSLINKLWISNPAKIELARNKIIQLAHAKELGISIPPTLITTDISSFNEFYKINTERVIIKSIKGHWYDNMNGNDYLFFTRLLDKSKLPTKESLELAPCLFQGYVEKDFELRVTVIGDKVFSAALYSQEDKDSKIDWRLGTRRIKHESYQLPMELEKKLKNMNKKLGINFGAYDLIVDKEGKFVFLEVNPNGQWVWIQERTGLKIKEALVDLLQYGEN